MGELQHVAYHPELVGRAPPDRRAMLSDIEPRMRLAKGTHLPDTQAPASSRGRLKRSMVRFHGDTGDSC
jgi:hypothetical protein